MTPKISIIVPIYNSEQYIDDCINSILSQTFSDFELILIDDGSTDNSGKICDNYAMNDSRIVVIHKENGGVSSSRNAGLDVAKGKYISFLDSDDWVQPNFLLNAITSCEEYKLDIYCAGFVRVFPDGTNGPSIISNPILGHTDSLTQEEIINLLENNYIAACMSKLFLREIIGLLRFDLKKAWGEDLEFIFSLLEGHHKIYAVPEMDYNYRVGHLSATASTNLTKCTNIAQTYNDLYSVITKRNFNLGTYSQFIDWRCKSDLLYTEQLILKSNKSILQKCQLLTALLNVSEMIPYMQDSALIRHLRLYSKHPILLLLRNVLQKNFLLKRN